MAISQYFYSYEAERYVAGALLQKGKKILALCHRLHSNESWFLYSETKCVYLAVEELVSKNVEIEIASVISLIQNKYQQSDIKSDTIQEIYECCTNPSNAMHHILTLRDRFKKRELSYAFQDLLADLESSMTAEDAISKADFVLQGHKSNGEMKTSVKDLAARVTNEFRKAQQTGCVGLPSRYLKLQRIMSGYPESEMTVIAGRPKQGKTTLALNEGLDWAKKGMPGGIISMEMNEEQIRQKLVADELKLDLFRFRNGEASNAEIEQFQICMERHEKLPLEIIDGPKGIKEIVSLLRSKKHEWRFGIVDHLHHIAQKGDDPKQTVDKITHYSDSLCNTAHDVDYALIVIAQLSRDAARDRHGRPVIPRANHLKGSGAIEANLAKLLMVYQSLEYGDELRNDNVDTKVRVDMNRFGKCGTVDLIFKKSESRFYTPGTTDNNVPF